jgi:dihydroorotate dehydrogenase
MMLGPLLDLARPMLFALEPESAHEVTLRAMEAGAYPRAWPDDARLAQRLMGLDIPNPIGIAAGFDKDARVPDAILASGFGFAEVGTLTPMAQSGNARPRVFRLIRDRALINRLGFNNGGHAAALARLERRRRAGVVGVNIGANKETADRNGDYAAGVTAFAAVASYLTINISSPNTPGLRDLQAPKALDELLQRITAARAETTARNARPVPLVVKLAPDVAAQDLPAIVERLLAHRIEAIAVSNTTLARDGLLDKERGREAGGLSGRPLFERSTRMLARVHQLSKGKVPLIGIGGIDSAESALAKIEAGASLVQLYTGLVYEGPGLIPRIKRGLIEAIEKAEAKSLGPLIGRRAAEWAKGSV